MTLDSVNHDIILRKLKYSFNIDAKLLTFIANYLNERTQAVVIGGSRSDILPVMSGVPQGSIIGPFVLFVNDLPNFVSRGTNISLHADDTKIWRRIECFEDYDILQRDIDSLFTWSLLNKMKFHRLKCKVLSITNCNRQWVLLSDESLIV